MAGILLLNLLIALLGSTFVSTRDNATLQGRVAFARIVRRLELVAGALGIDTHAGEKDADGGYVHNFRAVALDPTGEMPRDYLPEMVFDEMPPPVDTTKPADAPTPPFEA